jgi:diguanylate cyclase (GGDEF)-like protein
MFIAAYHPSWMRSHSEHFMRNYINLMLLALFLLSPVQVYGLVSQTSSERVDLGINGQLFEVNGENFPNSSNELSGWLSAQKAISAVNLFGGDYWFYAEVHNDSDIKNWVVSLDGTLIEQIEVRVYLPQGIQQSFRSGYRAEHDFMLHYGKRVNFPANSTAKILIRFGSQYFASHPRFELLQESTYRQRIVWENVLLLAAFGALLTLAFYNLFIYAITRDRAFIYYSSYLAAYFLGWAFTFHIPSELFGWRNLQLHYIPFFLLPVLNTLFYLEFLQLKKNFPRLAAISKINLILPLVLLPSCFIALEYAHVLATLVITIWLVIALVSGIVSWRNGFHPARYFVFAFIALLIPGAIILPANVGLIPDLVRNSELLTLLGGTLDAILLAFALADKIRVLSDEKDRALQHSNEMLALASTDHLTGIANRHAFDLAFKSTFLQPTKADDPLEVILFLIDIDGLKKINDSYGHARGDELLRTVSDDLKNINFADTSVYRLGGDEFTILSHRKNDLKLRQLLTQFEAHMHERGFDEAGISFGVAFSSECDSADEMLACADLRMYKFKSTHRRARAKDRDYPDSTNQSHL